MCVNEKAEKHVGEQKAGKHVEEAAVHRVPCWSV